MKWRKASELLPDENEPIVYRNSLTKKPIPYRKVSFSESFGNKWIRFYLTVSDITNVTVENVEWLDESTFLPSSSVTGEITGKTKEQCLKDRDVSIDRWPDTRDLIYLAMDDYAKQFGVTGESEAIGERKFTLDEILLYGARCAVNGRKMNPVAYFKEHFNVDITIGDNL